MSSFINNPPTPKKSFHYQLYILLLLKHYHTHTYTHIYRYTNTLSINVSKLLNNKILKSCTSQHMFYIYPNKYTNIHKHKGLASFLFDFLKVKYFVIKF